MFDIQGRLVLDNSYGSQNSFSNRIDVSGFAKGIYVVKVSKGDSIKMVKINII